MSVLVEVLRELSGLFLADARLSIATCLLVAAVAALLHLPHRPPLAAAFVLAAGAAILLVEATWREARRRRNR